MDQTARPCDDFYRYACGKWIDEHTNTNRGFTSLALKNTVLTDAIVLNASNTALHNMYQSCMSLFVSSSSASVRKRKQEGSESAETRSAILAHILDPLKTIDDLPRVFGRLVSFGYTSPVAFSIQSNPFAPGIVPAFSYDGFAGLEGNVPWVARHFALLDQHASDTDRAKKLITMIGDMPSFTASQMTSIEQWHDYLAEPASKAADLIAFEALPRLSPGWNWSHFVEEASHSTIRLSPRQMVWVSQKRAFLDKFRPEQFSVPQWRLYVQWSVLYHTHDFFPQLEEDVLFSFSRTTSRRATATRGGAMKKRVPREKGRGKRGGHAPAPGEEGSWDPQGVTRDDCLRLTKYLLPGQVSKRYLDAHFPLEKRTRAEKRVTEMVNLIKVVFRARLLVTPWMDQATRQTQADKIAAIVARVVEPLHGHWAEEDGLHMDPTRYVKNLNEIQSLRVSRNLAIWTESRYGANCDSQCRDKITAFGSPLSIVNAWYNPDRNVITIPAGILQPPFYEDRYDNVSAYATIGMVIAHELSHAQDPQGSLFDKDGLLRDTWSLESRRAYEAKAQCLVREYDSDNGVTDTCQGFSSTMVSAEKGSYGTQTLCENTADQVGLTLALDALGMTYTPRPGLPLGKVPDEDLRRFFLAFGQMWCSTYDQEEMCQRADDVHSLANLRVSRTLAHQADFSRVHGCLIGEPMHRLERCEIF
jgi:predicted metalloendopeptidase